MPSATSSELVDLIRAGYAAFAHGDTEGAIALFADDAEYVVVGASAISGTYRRKDAILGLWDETAQAGLSLTVDGFFTDGHRVVTLVTERVGDISWRAAAIFTFRDGKVIRFEAIEDTASVEQAFPTAR